MTIKYKLCEGNTAEELEGAVNDASGEGYQLTGSACVTSVIDTADRVSYLYTQAMYSKTT